MKGLSYERCITCQSEVNAATAHYRDRDELYLCKGTKTEIVSEEEHLAEVAALVERLETEMQEEDVQAKARQDKEDYWYADDLEPEVPDVRGEPGLYWSRRSSRTDSVEGTSP